MHSNYLSIVQTLLCQYFDGLLSQIDDIVVVVVSCEEKIAISCRMEKEESELNTNTEKERQIVNQQQRTFLLRSIQQGNNAVRLIVDSIQSQYILHFTP